MTDMFNLVSELESKSPKLPKNLLQQCLVKKRVSFEYGMQVSDEILKGQPQYHRTVAQFAQLLGRHELAFQNYQAIIEKNPTDFESRLKLFESWLSWKTNDLKRKSPKEITESQISFLISESDTLLKPLIEMKDTPTETKLAALRTRALLFETLTGDFTKALPDWRRIVELNPKNVEGLQKIVAFEMSRNNPSGARDSLLGLATINPQNIEVQRSLLQALYFQKDSELAREWSQRFLNIQESDPVVLSYSSWAFYESQNYEKAKQLAVKALKELPKDVLAKQIVSLCLLREAEKYLDSGQTALGMAKINDAIQTDPKNTQARGKLATLLFEQLEKEKNLTPQSKVKDYAKVTKLIVQILKDDPQSEYFYLILIESADKSKNIKIGAEACKNYSKNIGDLPSAEKVLQCARLYLSAKQPRQAKLLLNSATKNPAYAKKKEELMNLLLSID